MPTPGAPERIRTSDPLLRRQLLYPLSYRRETPPGRPPASRRPVTGDGTPGVVRTEPARPHAGAPGENRTPDLLVRSQPLYPPELRALPHRVSSCDVCVRAWLPEPRPPFGQPTITNRQSTISWWGERRVSNPQPLEPQSSALPVELRSPLPLAECGARDPVAHSAFRNRTWCAWGDLNARHTAPEAVALSGLSYRRVPSLRVADRGLRDWPNPRCRPRTPRSAPRTQHSPGRGERI